MAMVDDRLGPIGGGPGSVVWPEAVVSVSAGVG
jgi:hypothetical protein